LERGGKKEGEVEGELAFGLEGEDGKISEYAPEEGDALKKI